MRTLIPDRATSAALITSFDGGEAARSREDVRERGVRTWKSVRDHALQAPPERRLYLSILAREEDARRLLLAYRSEADAYDVRDRVAASMDAGLAARRQRQQQSQQRRQSSLPSSKTLQTAWRFLCVESWPIDELVRVIGNAGMGVLLHGSVQQKDGSPTALVFPAPDTDSEAARAQMRTALLHGWGWRG